MVFLSPTGRLPATADLMALNRQVVDGVKIIVIPR
jgi:hypothetical protein